MQIVAACINEECNEYLRVLHRQLIKVLKNKPSDIPPDAGIFYDSKNKILKQY